MGKDKAPSDHQYVQQWKVFEELNKRPLKNFPSCWLLNMVAHYSRHKIDKICRLLANAAPGSAKGLGTVKRPMGKY